MAPYHFSVTVHGDFEEAVGKTRAALAENGFGIVSEIDMAATLKEKLVQLKEAYAEDLLTEEEFERKKAELLASF